jgi:hypothetical protein
MPVTSGRLSEGTGSQIARSDAMKLIRSGGTPISSATRSISTRTRL